jgi:SAM-dependent methyltransferase
MITVAQAIHWFDPEPARKEMMRILKEEGWLVLVRNYGTNKEKYEAIRRLMTEEYGADLSVVTGRPKEKPSRFFFGNDDFKTFVYPFRFEQGWEEFLGTLTTTSFMPDEDHPLFPRLEADAKKLFSQFSEGGSWMVEGETEVIIGRPSRWANDGR